MSKTRARTIFGMTAYYEKKRTRFNRMRHTLPEQIFYLAKMSAINMSSDTIGNKIVVYNFFILITSFSINSI